MIIEQMPRIVRRLYWTVLWRMSSSEKTIYLTFDDGPTPEVTPWLLEQLDKMEVKATFFCIGRNVEQHPELFEEMKRRGHTVGIHGYDHKRGLFADNKSFFLDIRRAAALIGSTLFRPPHGHIWPSQAVYLSKKYKVVLWDVITRDYDRDLMPEQVYDIAIKYGRNGSIVVFHDSVKAMKNMMYAFPRAVLYWKKQGYNFKAL